MIRIHSFKIRLTIWYAAILLVFLTGFAFLMHTELSRTLYRDVENNMYAESRNLEDGIVASLRDNGTPRLSPPPRIEKGTIAFSEEYQASLAKAVRLWDKQQKSLKRSLYLARIVGLDHSVMLSNLGRWERDIIFPDFERDSIFMETGNSFQTIHFEQRPIRLYYRLVRIEGRPFFVIQIAKPLDEIDATLSRLSLIIALTIPLGVALAGWAGWFLAKRFLRPVDRMIQQARTITAAYLKSRLPRTFTQDELDRLAETLNEMIDRLEASTKAVQEFSTNVSHEFKTPLAIIRGEIDLALRRDRSQEDLHQALGVISEETDGLVRLVNDLNFLVKSDSKQMTLQKRPVSLAHLLEHVTSLYRDRCQKEGIALEFCRPPEIEVHGDDVYLKRLFMNLMDNAVKFTDQGGKIRIECFVRDCSAIVKITDTGIGIDAETLAHIGKRFCRSDQARSKEGAGLGLSIVHAICAAHEASIHFDSSPGKGTSVSVTLPL
ncbi:MAG TPA: HAMP domain-containing sensor histidine kinase [Candidatus Omnitrophota bacterium]|jgi:signal transduction histidine kinase|nr:HAMP domain-containing sensor histidine kinase [Candidatus Omnitrophota bacterium]HQB94670.1 HAMP domain-containing sensor histidine kinase [Candidatus Omnitrophota bacterium]